MTQNKTINPPEMKPQLTTIYCKKKVSVQFTQKFRCHQCLLAMSYIQNSSKKKNEQYYYKGHLKAFRFRGGNKMGGYAAHVHSPVKVRALNLEKYLW